MGGAGAHRRGMVLLDSHVNPRLMVTLAPSEQHPDAAHARGDGGLMGRCRRHPKSREGRFLHLEGVNAILAAFHRERRGA